MVTNIAATLTISLFALLDIFDSNKYFSMKKIFLLVLFFAPFSHAITLLEAAVANTLASNNIIVNNSADPSKYRLGETISRSETV